MAIVDLDKTKEVVDLYENLKQALAYSKEWSDRVISLTAALAANPVYLQNASPEEIQFITSANTVSDSFTKAVPVAPDVIAPILVVTPPVTLPPDITPVPPSP